MFVKNVNILKKIAFLFFIITALLPLTLLIVGIKTGFSIYQVGEIFTIDSENGYEVDTRTFLWYEVFDDLNKNNSLIWGKGLTGRIESILSDEFDYTVTNEGRAFVEVRFLDIFRRGGLVYCIIYYCVVLFASFYAIQKSKNRFLLFVSMSIVSFYFLNFIGNQPMFNLYSVYFWIFIGMCLSDKWNGYTDTEIKYLFHIKSSRKERVYISSNVSDKEYSKILKK